MSLETFTKTTFFKVPFTEALDLVMTRQCYVHGGYAFVPQHRLIVILVARFRVSLSKSLTQASLAFTHITGVEESSRIAPLLYTMNSQYTGRSYDTSVRHSSFDGSNVDNFVQNMPLCMSQLHQGLQSDHKLKHWGRLQYGLFLKGAGLTMEDSMLFFQKEFTKIMSPEKFQKEYAYNIRHMYGKEGKRTDYTPYNCSKIILGNPPQGSGEHHGCPFKHYDDEHLSSLLQKLRIGQGDRDAILNHKQMKNFSLACIKHFEATHPNYSSVKDLPLNGVGDHPNAWFAASVKYREAKTTTKDTAVDSLEKVDVVEP
jgi:DNA primase large subunit